MKRKPHFFTVSVTVVGGAGSTTRANSFGNAGVTFIDAPAGAHYNYRVNDTDGDPVQIQTGLIDDTFDKERYPMNGSMTWKIFGADTDGAYRLKVWNEDT